MIKRETVPKVLLFLTLFLVLTPPLAESAQEVTFKAIPETSQIWFVARTAFSEFTGKAEAFSLVIVSPDRNTLRDSSLRVTIEAGALDTGNRDRDNDMRRVLGVDEYTTIEFHSSHITGLPEDYVRDDTASLEIPGRLSLHGVTRNVTFPVEVKFTGDQLTARGEITIRLSDFHISRPRLFFFFPVKDEVRILFNIESRRSE